MAMNWTLYLHRFEYWIIVQWMNSHEWHQIVVFVGLLFIGNPCPCVCLGSNGIVCGVCRSWISCSSYDGVERHIRRTQLFFFRVISMQMKCVHLVGFTESNQVQFYLLDETKCGVCGMHQNASNMIDWTISASAEKRLWPSKRKEGERVGERDRTQWINFEPTWWKWANEKIVIVIPLYYSRNLHIVFFSCSVCLSLYRLVNN